MPTRHVEDAWARFGRVPFAARLGVTVAELAHDRAVLVLPYQPGHMNAGGVLNGGASASLVAMRKWMPAYMRESALSRAASGKLVKDRLRPSNGCRS